MMNRSERRRIDQVLDPDFLADLGGVTTDELRARRRMVDEVETEVSYYRRLLHGRMDLLAFELRRRRGEETRSLIEARPEILGGGETASGVGGRVPANLAPDLPEVGRRPIDRVLQDDFLARIGEIDDEELSRIQEALSEAEQGISERRRAVQEAFDAIQGQITDRYKSGRVGSDPLP
ncbi:MAG: hypothetical protein ACRDVM_03980 [Acidimicrobiia bacterium]